MITDKGLVVVSDDKTGPDQNDKGEGMQHEQVPSSAFN
jgi:hypothetical protein